MYCQPHVEAVLNFLLKDEPQMARWQSGVFWADGTPKGSLEAYRSVIAEVNEGRVNCAVVPGAGAPAVTANAAVRSPSSGSGAPGQPQAQRSASTLSYNGPSSATFGALRLRAHLSRGATKTDKGLEAKQVTFVVDGETYLTTTDARGVASLVPTPAIRPGKHRVEVRFRGDELSMGSFARTDVSVVNSRGSVVTTRLLRLAPKLRVRLVARSDGATVTGTLTLRRPEVTRIKLNAMGLAGNRRAAWLGGTAGSNHFDVQVRRLATGRVRIQVWRNGVELHRPVTLPAAAVRIRG